MSIYEENNILLEAEQEDVCQFADAITPPNWHFGFMPGDMIFVPGALNIQLGFLEDDQDDGCMAKVYGGMRVTNLEYFKAIKAAADALKIYGDCLIAHTEILFHPLSFNDLKNAMVHELAHVAVYRYGIKQQKLWNKEILAVQRRDHGHDHVTFKESDLHGPLWKRFYIALLDRANKVYGERTVESHLFLYE